MPFRSKAQWRWAFATGQSFARRWAHETPGGKRRRFRALPAAVEQRKSAPSELATPADRARHAALVRWGKQQPRSRAESREAQRRARAAEQRNATLSRYGVNETERSAIDALARGDTPDAASVQSLVARGIVEIGDDGTPRFSSLGRSIYNAASRGDAGAVRDLLSRAEDEQRKREKRAQQEAQRKEERERTQQERERAKQEREQRKEERAKRSGGGGGGKGKEKEKRETPQEKREKMLNETIARLGIDPDAIATLRRAAEMGGGDDERLRALGLIDERGEATNEGRSALRALERGDVSLFRAALLRAQERLEKQERRATRDERRRNEE